MKKEYLIRQKLVNGVMKYGLIDEELNCYLPFEQKLIEQKTCAVFDEKRNDYYQENYYVFNNVNDKIGLFVDGKEILLGDKYSDIELLPISLGNNVYCKVGKLVNGKKLWGILHIDYAKNKVVEAYPFGKADKIEVCKGRVNLTKRQGVYDLRGLFMDKELGTLDPEYIYFVKPLGIQNNLCSEKVLEYFKKRDLDISRAIELIDPITTLRYGKMINGELLVGMYVKSYDKNIQNPYSFPNKKHFWKELVPCEYKEIIYDEEKYLGLPFIYLKKHYYGRDYHGLMSCTRVWDKDALQTGRISFSSLETQHIIPCQDDKPAMVINASYSNSKYNFATFYMYTYRDGKQGLIKLFLERNRFVDRNNKSKAVVNLDIMLFNNYDEIMSAGVQGGFIFRIENEKGIIFDLKANDNEFLKTGCYSKDIEHIEGTEAFKITNQNGQIGVLTMVPKENRVLYLDEDYYKFQNIPCRYEDIVILRNESDKKGNVLLGIENRQATGAYTISCEPIVQAATNFFRLGDDCYKILGCRKDSYADIYGNDKEQQFVVNDNGRFLLYRVPMDEKIEYYDQLKCFAIRNDKEIQVVNRNDIDSAFAIPEGKYEAFEVVETTLQNNNKNMVTTLVKYKKHYDGYNKLYGLWSCKYNCITGATTYETLLDDLYESIDFVCGGTRVIASAIRNDGVKFGVYETRSGKECIPVEYEQVEVIEPDRIGLDKITEKGFLALNKHEMDVYDYYGCLVGNRKLEENSLLVEDNDNELVNKGRQKVLKIGVKGNKKAEDISM